MISPSALSSSLSLSATEGVSLSCRRGARRRESIGESWSFCVETENGCGGGIWAEFQVEIFSPFFLSSFSGPHGAWIEMVLRCHFVYGTDFELFRTGEEVDFWIFDWRETVGRSESVGEGMYRSEKHGGVWCETGGRSRGQKAGESGRSTRVASAGSADIDWEGRRSRSEVPGGLLKSLG